MTEEAHDPECLLMLRRFAMCCLLFSYSGNVMKNHSRTRKTHPIWPLLNNLIKPARYTNMKEPVADKSRTIASLSENWKQFRSFINYSVSSSPEKLCPLGHSPVLSSLFLPFQRSHGYLCLCCTQLSSQVFLRFCTIIHVFFLTESVSST